MEMDNGSGMISKHALPNVAPELVTICSHCLISPEEFLMQISGESEGLGVGATKVGGSRFTGL